MAPSSSLPHHLLFVLVLTSSSVAVLAAAAASSIEGNHGPTHILLYVHGKNTGANATAAAVLQSPLGASSSFGSMGVVDDEIRVGPDRSSQLVGRFQGVFFGTSMELGKGYQTSISLVFTAGRYSGSTLSVEGPHVELAGTIERAVVGGTGKFRLARGYTLLKMISKPTPETDIHEINLFVLVHPAGKY